MAQLKSEIKRESPELDVAAKMLNLYQLKGVAFDPSGTHLEKVRKISEKLGDQDSPKLNEWLKISDIEGGFPQDMLHILVVPPAGESINSRACTCEHGRAEKGQSPTTFEHTVH